MYVALFGLGLLPAFRIFAGLLDGRQEYERVAQLMKAHSPPVLRTARRPNFITGKLIGLRALELPTIEGGDV
ncbi:hypothetical protein DD236_03870 [Ancrocorticia populi]|uniref:Uncharacterized protein n=1 Tax=Ancrocorticia populi TaxID=2175228 RepID=A0A2V1KAQ0_9ACTO|nr:hypothetical protein DD236_03870 [Ancrocorticia populi]